MPKLKRPKRRFRLYRERTLAGIGKVGPLPRRSYATKETAIEKLRMLIWQEYEDDLLSVVDEHRGKQVAALKRRGSSVVEW